MLSHLSIQHYALIEHLEADLHEGFSVITGETGAGKSIVLGALSLLLGGRADVRSLPPGAKKCVVEATFSLRGMGLDAFFSGRDIDFDGDECVVRRELTASGKSRAFLNDTPVQLSALRELGSHIIDIHSQHQNLLMGSEHFLITLLDTIAGDQSQLETYRSAYNALQQAQQRLQDLREATSRAKEEEEFMRFQHQALQEARLRPGEQEDLEAEAELLRHAEEIKDALYTSAGTLMQEDASPSAGVRACEQRLRAVQSVCRQAGELAERLESARIELDDIANELQREADAVEFRPERLALDEQRLSLIYTLQQRFHAESVEQLMALEKELAARLAAIDSSEDDLREAEQQLQRSRAQATKAAAELTGMRTQAAHSVEEQMTALLQTLGMPSVRLRFTFEQRENLDPLGCDRATLLFAANKGGALLDVASTASGGETARLMLALKTTLARVQHMPTIIFDEIDTGTSGSIAEQMAGCMSDIATHTQVICITHLPQIAAKGKHHYRVSKHEDEQGTQSHFAELSAEERVEEIAHMLSGTTLTPQAVANAKALLSTSCG